jgi:zinc protease
MVMKSKKTNLFRNANIFGLLLTSMLTAPVFAQELPKGVKKVASVEGITEYNLENGLKVLMFPDPSKANDHGECDLSGRISSRRIR